ncbi:MAG TPA: hypothetical protein VIM79_19440, partial [Niastella sp.]
MGPLYSSYGLYLIKRYPIQFLRHFVWPNSLRYFGPPVTYLGYYNWNKRTVPESVVRWFGYKNNQVKTRMKSSKAWSLQPYPFLLALTNLLMLLGLLSYVLLKGWQYNTTFNKCILMAGFVWLANAGFTIFASSAELRFQAFPAMLSFTFSLLLIDWMARLMEHLKRQNIQQSTSDFLLR